MFLFACLVKLETINKANRILNFKSFKFVCELKFTNVSFDYYFNFFRQSFQILYLFSIKIRCIKLLKKCISIFRYFVKVSEKVVGQLYINILGNIFTLIKEIIKQLDDEKYIFLNATFKAWYENHKFLYAEIDNVSITFHNLMIYIYIISFK